MADRLGSGAPTSTPPTPGSAYLGMTLDGRYRLTTRLGCGGMGSVFLAEHTLLTKPVAVKVLDCQRTTDQEGQARLFREAQAAAAIGHPNIIDIVDVGVTPMGDPYLVMEYLPGEDLARYLGRIGPVGVSTACAVLEPILLALHAAHSKKIIHRDIKPANVFLVRREAALTTVKLIDFGIAKFAHASVPLTADGAVLGTPSYMSPEQARGSSQIDSRADLYAVGVIFYEMLTGQLPFGGHNYNEILHRIVSEDPREIASCGHAIPDDARTLIRQALSKNAEERYQSAAEMLEAFESLAAWQERSAAFGELQEKIESPTVSGTESTPLAGSIAAYDSSPALLRGAPARSTPLSGEAQRQNAATRVEGLAPTMTSAQERRRPLEVAEEPAPSSRLLRDDTRPPPRRGLIMPLAIFILGIGLALFAFPEGPTAPATDSSAIPPPLALSEAPSQSAEGMSHDEVTLTLRDLPAGATIYYDGQRVLENPFQVPRRTATSTLRVEFSGHTPFTAAVTPDADLTLSPSLIPLRDDPKSRPSLNRVKAGPIGSDESAEAPASSAAPLGRTGRGSLYLETFE